MAGVVDWLGMLWCVRAGNWVLGPSEGVISRDHSQVVVLKGPRQAKAEGRVLMAKGTMH